MVKYCPSHIEEFVIDASDRFVERADAFHHHYQLKCGCEASLFYLFSSDKQTIKALCHGCLESLLVYDLSRYPAACKLTGREAFSPMEETREFPKPIYVAYEYGELDADQEHDQNDITWCEIFAEVGGRMVKVFEDETA